MPKVKKKKPIHLIIIVPHGSCRCACDFCLKAHPLEDTLDWYNDKELRNLGTFDVRKVTCKRCLKTEKYRRAYEKRKYPLFHWKENL